MKFSCNATELKKAINIAQKAITGKSATPILSGIYMNANGNQLILRGSDLTISIQTCIAVEVEENGEILVNAKLVSELVGKLNGLVTIYEEGQEVIIKSGNNNFYNTPKMNADDYPDFPEINPKNTIKLPEEEFKKLVGKTQFACSNDENRPLFTGVYVEVKEGKVTFVGTNTHRLAIQSLPMEGEEVSCVIPAKILNEICNIADSFAEPPEITVGLLYNQVMICLGETKLVTRLLDGRFPDYRRVIPKTYTISAVINRMDLLSILDRVIIFSKFSNHGTVRMNFTGNKLYINASSADIGTAKEELDCEIEGNDLNIAFNASYLLDVLRHTEAEKVTFRLNTSLTPGIVDTGDQDFIYIVTPVRVL